MKISKQDRIIIVYSFDEEDQRYIGSFEYHWAQGTGLPNQGTDIQPPKITADKTAVFNIETDKWSLAEDNRGKTAYSTIDQTDSKIDYIGPIKFGFTELKPNSIFDTWNGEAWEDQRTDEEKEAEHLKQFSPLTRRQFKLSLLKNNLLSTIESTIESIQDTNLKLRIKIEYEESERFERTNESVLYMLKKLKLTYDRVDEMWLEAMSL